MKTRRVFDAALALPEQDRAELARDLLRSLDGPPDSDVHEAWVTEIEKRARELAAGSITPVDWSAARERIGRRLRERTG